MSNDSTTRLNKYLALHLGIARREADELIYTDRVSINGATAKIGNRVSDNDSVSVDGTTINKKSHTTTIVVNKPAGYVCSRKRQGDAPTIYQLLPSKYHALKPIGRLDKDSSGVLLLSDDGDLAHQLTHPSFHKQKTYEISLDQPLQPLHRQMISDFGIDLDDGPSKLELERIIDGDDAKWRVMMHEGRNRQIRRTFAALGYTVTTLHRTHFGNYSLADVTALDDNSV